MAFASFMANKIVLWVLGQGHVSFKESWSWIKVGPQKKFVLEKVKSPWSWIKVGPRKSLSLKKLKVPSPGKKLKSRKKFVLGKVKD